MSWVLSPAKKKKKKNDDKRAKIYAGNQVLEDDEGSEPQREHPVLQNSLRTGTPLPPRR